MGDEFDLDLFRQALGNAPEMQFEGGGREARNTSKRAREGEVGQPSKTKRAKHVLTEVESVADKGSPIHHQVMSPRPQGVEVEANSDNVQVKVDQPDKAIYLSSLISHSPRPTQTVVARTISSGPHGMTPPQPPSVEVPRLPNLLGLVLFGRGPPSQVDFVTTTNERSNSLWCLNVDLVDVRIEVGRFNFPSAYDAELLNVMGVDGAVASGISMCGRLMPPWNI